MTAPRQLSRHHWTRAARFDRAEFRHAWNEVEGFNAKVAVTVTHLVGTMACAYVFCGLALVGLPGAIHAGVPGIVQWVAQTFLQLVLLSVIMVGQQVQARSDDARVQVTDQRDRETHDMVKRVLSIVDTKTGE
jgi:hypothetical protein